MKKMNLVKMMNLRSLALVGILALAVLTVSCEDDGDVYTPTANESELKSGKAVKKSNATIADIVKADDGEFDILQSLLEVTGLIGVFEGSDQYTVFAPTDAAFEALFEVVDPATLSQEQITNILLYHVAEGRRAANSVLPKKDGQMKSITTLSGQMFSVDNGANIYTNAMGMSAIVVSGPGAGPGMTYNVSASNGVIHVINAVLIPQEF